MKDFYVRRDDSPVDSLVNLAETNKLLGEMYLARAHQQESNADIKAKEFLTASLSLYQELDISSKATEVEQLLTQ